MITDISGSSFPCENKPTKKPKDGFNFVKISIYSKFVYVNSTKASYDEAKKS